LEAHEVGFPTPRFRTIQVCPRTCRPLRDTLSSRQSDRSDHRQDGAHCWCPRRKAGEEAPWRVHHAARRRDGCVAACGTRACTALRVLLPPWRQNCTDRVGEMMPTIRMIVAVTTLVTAIAPATAQNWPTRPVTIVYPFGAGSAGDVLGRIFASRLSELLGQPVIFENVGGAGGMTGASRVAKAAPDGYQVLLGTTSTLAVNQTFYRNPLYNAVTDFAPVALSPRARLCWSRARICPRTICRSSSPMRKRTRRRCNTARPEWAPRSISPARGSMQRSASASRTFPIAAAARRCRI
jgi:tripartite tricarboxylate transporter family receptor